MGKRRKTPDMGDLLSGQAQPKSLPQKRPLTKEEKKKAKEKALIKKRLPNRATYDLPPGMKEKISAIAEEHETTASQVAALLLHKALLDVDVGLIDFDYHKEESSSIRWKYILRIDEW